MNSGRLNKVQDRRASSGMIGARQLPLPASPGSGRFAWLAPMVLWPLARRHLPHPAVRPQGGGTQRADDEAMFAAIVYVLVSGVPWRALPRTFAVSWQNTHRRFAEWSYAGLWEAIQQTSRSPHIPVQVTEWADTVAARAAGRLNRGKSGSGAARASGDGSAATQPRGFQEPVIKVHRQDDFTDRLFGPPRTRTKQVPRQPLPRAE